MKSILLIDDAPEVIAELQKGIRKYLPEIEAEIRIWTPGNDETDPLERFTNLVDRDTVLVVTDIDLTGHGQTGLFGASIVAWCQIRAIPVGDYSRDPKWELPKEPNLFEMRVPKDAMRAAAYISGVFRGFAQIRDQLAANADLSKMRSPPAAIAALLGEPSLESQFELYGVRLGATSASFVERIVHTPQPDAESATDEKQSLLAYIVGHLLLNSVLRFPGPIASLIELTAYVGVSPDEMPRIAELFCDAQYTGPFKDLGPYYWLHRVDEILRPLLDAVAPTLQAEPETHGEFNRLAIERKLQVALARHACPRCHGVNGGFWCPFTKRAVCLRSDCSVGANSWVPQGARMCRIERTFYDEWAPILGI
jgi:hypothetical protein